MANLKSLSHLEVHHSIFSKEAMMNEMGFRLKTKQNKIS